MTTINNQLILAGLEKKAAMIIEILMSTGSASAGMIASRSKIKRPTVYQVLDNLLAQGLINRSKRSGRTMFHLQDPKAFVKQIATTEQKNFESKLLALNSLTKLLEELKVRQATMLGDIKIDHLQRGSEIQETVGQLISSGDFCAIFNPNVTTVGKMKEINKEFLRKTAVSKPVIRELIVDGKRARWYTNLIANPNHSIRYLPAKTPYELDLIIAGDSILMAQYGLLEDNCILITHAGFAIAFKALFEIMWGAIHF